MILPPAADVGVAANPWFDWGYVTDNVDAILTATRQHVVLTLVPVAIGLGIALPLAMYARSRNWLRTTVMSLSGILYSIPSLAAIVALRPVFGLRMWTVVFPLAAYTLVILFRNIFTGLDEVPEETIEAARGMGLGSARLLWQVRLPLALPALMAGLRITLVSTIELVVIGGFVGQGGYGYYIFEGFQNNFYRAEITTFSILTVLLALFADALVLALQRVLTPWRRGLT